MSGYVQVSEPKTAAEVMARVKERQAALRDSSGTMQNKIRQLTETIKTLQAENDNLRQQVSERGSTIEELLSVCRDLRVEIKDMASGHRQQREEFLIIQGDVKALCETVLAGFPGIDWTDIISKRKALHVRKPRQICHALAMREFRTVPYSMMGRVFERDGTTLHHSVQVCERNGWLELYR